MTRPAHQPRVIEFRFPLRGSGPFDWIEDVDEFLMGLFHIDDGHEAVNERGEAEYVFALANADDSTLIAAAHQISTWPLIPLGSYCLVPDRTGLTRVDLPLSEADQQRWSVPTIGLASGGLHHTFNRDLSPVTFSLAERFDTEAKALGAVTATADPAVAMLSRQVIQSLEALAQIEIETGSWPAG